jgi:cell division protein FtsI/penicillin-binding protein 2
MSENRNRLIIVLAGVALIALCIIGKLFLLQIVHGETFAKRADRQYAPSSTGVFDRGTIYATRKDGTLATLASVSAGFKLAIVPGQLTDKEVVYSALNAIVPIDYTTFIARASKITDPYEEITTRIPKNKADAIRDLKLKGVYLYQDTWRSYPAGSLASKVVGFVGFKGDTLTGRYGLERYYNDVLLRLNTNIYKNFFAEVFHNLKDTFSNTTKEGDIVTTIEPMVQAHLEKQLFDVRTKYSADLSAGIIMDARTGAVVAMAALPDFDPNEYGRAASVSHYGNPLVESIYELGSVVKALTLAAGIDAKVITPESTYVDKGFVELNGSKLRNFDGKGRGVTTMQTVLSESLNTGVVHVMQKLGRESFRNYLYGFGLNSMTGIDLPGEVNNQVANLKSTRDVEYGTASFGQGIALTPITAIRAFSALANDGVPVNPYIVSEIRYPEGTSKKVEPKTSLPAVISPESSAVISQMLTTAFEGSSAGRASGAKAGPWNIAGKTGTAQIAKESGGGYYSDRFLHSVLGYFPATNPRYVVLMYMVNPQGERFSSNTIAYSYAETARFVLNYYQIPPDR